MVRSSAQRFWSAVAAATAFLVLALAPFPYGPQAESGSCCDRTPKAGCARNAKGGGLRLKYDSPHNMMWNGLRNHMSMKIIQVPIDNVLLGAVTRLAKARRSSRAALIREACQRYLERIEEEELDRKYVEGYRRKPESASVGKLGERMAKEVWPKEDWNEAW
jgi:hypothetical protein